MELTTQTWFRDDYNPESYQCQACPWVGAYSKNPAFWVWPARTIQTPPQDRLPVETIIAGYDERLIRKAIQRELDRGGQVYFLHNRVQSIEAVAERLRRLFDVERASRPLDSTPENGR
ncbi:MAG: hypothetical protein COB96_03435, partial [Planctomycetota bacterium]